MENPNLFEGDIMGIENIEDLNATPKKGYLWPGGQVPYRIKSPLKYDNILDYSPLCPVYAMRIIKSTMRYIEDRTCIRFVPRTSEKNYVNIIRDVGCYTYVGRSRNGPHDLSLGSGCVRFPIVLHELTHVLGFFHEHNRSDRDDYLRIIWDNISIESKTQFNKMSPSDHLLLAPFDYESIQLYGSRAFSEDGFSKTIVAKDGSRLLETYEKKGYSKHDIKKIRTLYKC
ncbi:hypothetical protein LAZ67_14002511 [Cordylochernes scorpioides]|uniref:Metalloendopeptidase n=1 Tax=Cordylochernes scorpioides TaxID=51811 RepID=A0ABY6L7E2_9ARAC|nr:hypothetical protein LAZ67_14002511 [Cordylochernes scorpioides]